MPKKPDKRQASFNDVVIEDKDVARHLKTIADFEEAVIAYRRAVREVKTLVKTGYEDAINSDRDGEHSGYIVCGGYRFRADVTTKPEQQIPAKPAEVKPSSQRWGKLDVHRADLFSTVDGAEG